MRVIFMGTPDFVIPVLSPLVNAPDVDLAAVYTPPDRPRGRGQSVEMPPVKQYALEQGLTVCQPPGFRGAAARDELAALRPDVMVVAAYGRLLPRPVLDAAPGGCLNLHPSLLPKYRGPSPVATAIRDGLTATGVTLMLLDDGMDTGPVIAQREHPISPSDTAGSLTADLFQTGAALLMENIRGWVNGEIQSRRQEHDYATVTRKLERADGQADWTLSAQELERMHRAYSPWPGLFTQWNGLGLKLLDVAAVSDTGEPPGPPGTVAVLENDETPLGVVTGRGVLGLKTVQLEGRRAVTAAAFRQGYPSFTGARLESVQQ